MNDEIIISTFFNKNGRLNGNHSTEEWLEKHNKEALEYLKTRFTDSESLRETFLRIYFKIEERPKCPICGEKRTWRGKKQHLYNDTCTTGKCYCKLRDERMLKKYGKTNFGGTEESIKKMRQTKLERYGDPGYHNTEKMKKTCLERYGEESIFKVKEFKENINNIIISKYGGLGGASSEILEKMKNTCTEKYGVDNYRKTKECVDKIYKTKKKNNTVNSSSYEDKIYTWLCEEYSEKNIIRQYIDNRYTNPENNRYFHCDFYIKPLDIFIEFQGHWGHGKHPFNEKSDEDLKIINEWKSKNKKCYSQAILKWTEIDPLKRKVAKTNNLKYIEIFDLEIDKTKLIKIINSYDNI